jgi:SAM-dependent methyltransferase
MMGQLYADALGGAIAELEYVDGTRVALETARWFDLIDGDQALLERCASPTLDIGSGPGRLTVALTRRGVRTLGIDITPRAVALTRRAGGFALLRDVFDEVPGSGQWKTALLADGNIGIGGDPAALLTRVKALLMPTGGELVVETASEDVDERHRLRVDGHGTALPWARLGTAALRAVAEQLGYVVSAQWQSQDRHFVALTT